MTCRLLSARLGEAKTDALDALFAARQTVWERDQAAQTAWTATSKVLKHASVRVRIAANRKNLYVTGKTLRPRARGRDLLTSEAPFERRRGRKINSPEEWARIYVPSGKPIYGPAAVAGTEQTLTLSEYTEEFGNVIDRIGGEEGRWFSPVKDGKVYSFESRGIPEGSKDLEYNQFTLPKEIPGCKVEISQVAPSLGHPGGAIQV